MERWRQWCRLTLTDSEGAETGFDVGGPAPPDLQAVDALARLALAVRRGSGSVRLSEVSPHLRGLLHLLGLNLEMQAEPDDEPPARGHCTRPGATCVAMCDEVQVRPVLPGEYEPSGRVVVAAYEALPGGHLSEDYAAELADVERRAREAEVLVAVDSDGDVVGCVTFVPDGSSPWAEMLEPGEAAIRMLAVDPKAQRRGAGRALLDACIVRAKELERSAIVLHTTPWMPAAHHLYETTGFQRLPERDWAPVANVALLAYRLQLR
jgi:ribosomal protein S18 acetylase RimI-like enzyme